jgi:alpha-beta hydrolase superfamily lysophospholipase
VDLAEAAAGLEHEDLTIRVDDLALAACFLRGAHPARGGPVLLIAHGWGASSGTVMQHAGPLARKGHDTLLFDMRGHGRNQAAPFVTVRHLRDDVLAAVRYTTERFPARDIVLVGHSFGGAASVLAVAEGARVSGLVLIATPSDVLRITAEFLTDKGLPGGFLVTVLRPFWWWRLGGTFRPHSPARRIRELDVPILIIQPELDQRVHRRHAERLSEAANVPYHLVPGREHTDVLAAPMTIELLEGFLSRLGSAAAAPVRWPQVMDGPR